jgi:hypothetical protein
MKLRVGLHRIVSPWPWVLVLLLVEFLPNPEVDQPARLGPVHLLIVMTWARTAILGR